MGKVYRHLLFNRLGREDDELDVSLLYFTPLYSPFLLHSTFITVNMF